MFMNIDLSVEQANALLNVLVDEVRSDEKHPLAPVLDAVGDIVAENEKDEEPL